jgi:drug/metabolite transporter (DMT)-like permease
MRTLSLVFFLCYVALLTYSFFFTPAPPALSTTDYLVLVLNGVRVAVVHVLYVFAVKKAGPLLAGVLVVLMVPMTFPFDRVWNNAVISTPLVLGSVLIVLSAVGLLSDELRRAKG